MLVFIRQELVVFLQDWAFEGYVCVDYEDSACTALVVGIDCG